MVHEFKSQVRPCADSSEPVACFRVCLPLSLSLPHSHSVSLCLSKINITKKIKKPFNVYLSSEKRRVNSVGTERDGGRGNPKQASHFQHRWGAWTHEPWDHDLSQNQESGFQALLKIFCCWGFISYLFVMPIRQAALSKWGNNCKGQITIVSQSLDFCACLSMLSLLFLAIKDHGAGTICHAMSKTCQGYQFLVFKTRMGRIRIKKRDLKASSLEGRYCG